MNPTARNAKMMEKYGGDIAIPGFKAELIPYQKVGVNFGIEVLNNDPHGYINADEQGLGKTIEALAISMHFRKEVNQCLIVCPPQGIEEWERMIRDFTTASFVCIQDRHGFNSRAFYGIINHAFLPRVIDRIKESRYGFIIVDEFHNFKNREAQRTMALRSIDMPVYKIGLSGTPVLNRADEAWPMLNYIDPTTWKDYFSFASRYCKFEKRGFRVKKGSRYFTYFVDKFVGVKNMKEFRHKIRPIFIRRRKSEVSDLPPKTYQPMYVNLTSAQNQIYKKILSNLKIEIKSAKKDKSRSKVRSVVNKFQRLRQVCQTTYTLQDKDDSSKLDLLIELLGEQILPPTKVFIVTPFKASANAAYDRIRKMQNTKYNPVLVTGDISVDEATKRKKIFQTNPRCRAFVGTIAKNRECINLPMADYVIFIGEDLVPKYNEQVEDRAHRIVGRNNVPLTVIRLLVRDSIETRIEEEILRPKIEMFNEVIEAISVGGKKLKSSGDDIIDVIGKLIGE